MFNNLSEMDQCVLADSIYYYLIIIVWNKQNSKHFAVTYTDDLDEIIRLKQLVVKNTSIKEDNVIYLI